MRHKSSVDFYGGFLAKIKEKILGFSLFWDRGGRRRGRRRRLKGGVGAFEGQVRKHERERRRSGILPFCVS